MGTGEDGTPSKNSKSVPSSQEIQTTPYPDWSSAMQAYYGSGATPPPFFAPTVASPTPHPYLWGSQPPLIAPYGTPLPYPVIYPPGGIYAHPNMAMTPGTVHTNTELEGKTPEGKDRALAKKMKGNAGNAGSAGGKAGDGKVASGSGNDGASQSAESGTEGSSDGSDENPNEQEFTANKKGSFDQMLADGANARSSGKPVGSVPGTNLNIGMNLWNTSSGSGSAKVVSNLTSTSSAIIPATMIGREGLMPDQWIQDERELKRQKRKLSNRESARRSRLRKQAECEELQAKVHTLSNENRTLRDELQILSQECEKLTSENTNIKEELTRLCGPSALANIERGGGGEGDS